MYYDRYFPFYMSYSSPFLFEGERMQEKEFSLMKSYYPEMAARIQEIVEEECQIMDYEGSRLYDEYPDRMMLRQTCKRIREQVQPQTEAQEVPSGFLDDLIQVLLYQEISRRRCRRHRCRRFF